MVFLGTTGWFPPFGQNVSVLGIFRMLLVALVVWPSYAYTAPVEVGPGLFVDFEVLDHNQTVNENDTIQFQARIINDPSSTEDLVAGGFTGAGFSFGNLIFNETFAPDNPYEWSTGNPLDEILPQLVGVVIPPGGSFDFIFGTLIPRNPSVATGTYSSALRLGFGFCCQFTQPVEITVTEAIEIGPGLFVDFKVINPDQTVSGTDVVQFQARLINDPTSTRGFSPSGLFGWIIGGGMGSNFLFRETSAPNNPYDRVPDNFIIDILDQLRGVVIPPGGSADFIFTTLIPHNPPEPPGTYSGTLSLKFRNPAFGTCCRIFQRIGITITDEDSQTIAAPADLRAIPGNQMVDLWWNTDGEGIQGWNVFFREQGEVDFRRIENLATPTDPNVPTTDTPFYRVNRDPLNTDDKLLTNGITYEFGVTAVSEVGDETDMSNVVAAVPSEPKIVQPTLPVLFLHGIASNADTWNDTKNFLVETWGWKFGGQLEVIDFLPGCTLDVPCAGFIGEHTLADFYTANFGDKNANYSNALGIRQQGREVKAFLERIQTVFFSPNQQFIVVAHSMAGLAARSYMVGLGTAYDSNIAQLITYGTPHKGTPVATILGDSLIAAFLDNFFQFPIDPNGDAVRDMDPPSDFLTELSGRALPLADYISIMSLTLPPRPLKCSVLEFLVDLGSSDCLVSVASQDLRNIVFPDPAIRDRVRVFHASRLHWDETKDHTSIACALNISCAQFFAMSPVNLEVVAPNGLHISKSLNEIPGASYEELDEDGDGDPSDTITIPFSLPGEYTIRVVAESDASPTDTYTLEVSLNGVIVVLAQDQQIQNIPSEPFSVVAAELDIKPGSDSNPIEPQSKGKIPVVILSTAGFDAPFEVDHVSLTFGRTGDEESLAFCAGSEDVNNDGLLDLVCHFNTLSASFQQGSTTGILKGQTIAGAPMMGIDAVRIIGR